jgi:hypothetical protein
MSLISWQTAPSFSVSVLVSFILARFTMVDAS